MKTETVSEPAPPKLGVGQPKFEPGYWGDMRQPAVLFPVQVPPVAVRTDALQNLDSWRAAVFSQPVALELLGVGLVEQPILRALALLALDVLVLMKMPVMAGARALRVQQSSQSQWLLGLPAVDEEVPASQVALQWAKAMVGAWLAGQLPVPDQVQIQLQGVAQKFGRMAPTGVNTLRFLQAAHEHHIPWRRVAKNVYQFGWGRRARWLDSSFTDRTPSIGAALARDKQAAAKALRAVGVPVPAHRLVTTVEQAMAAAQALGYPVVVKPVDQDGGHGVFAGMRTSQAVQHAFAEAAKLSRRVLVEQFVPGNDYRLQVFQGEVFWVVHRRPAMVLGDGVSTVDNLMERIQRQRAAARLKPPDDNPMAEQGSSPFVVDHELHEWLQAQGLNLDSVPPAGQPVRLRGAANVGMGGTREGVPLQLAHPDNLALAVKAAAVLRLDLAGIDLLVPDIARSWRETGGAICEVNGQPQLAGHLHRQLLPWLVSRQGRVPVVGLVLPPGLRAEQQQVQQALRQRGITVAWADSSAACHQALADPDVEAVVWQMVSLPPRHTPLPVDTLNLLIDLRDTPPVAHQNAAPKYPWPTLRQRSRDVWHLKPDQLTQSLITAVYDLHHDVKNLQNDKPSRET